jgi:quercetin dioxygenase-like cupin family protein
MNAAEDDTPWSPTLQARRVVTGVDPSGRSVVLSDGAAPMVLGAEPELRGTEYEGFEIIELWQTQATPPDLSGDDLSTLPFELDPVPGGVHWRLVAWPPMPRGRIHKTDTVDLMYILSGEIYLGVGDDEESLVETLLRPGDSVVALANVHSWRNAGPAPCVAVSTMLSTAPVHSPAS